MQRGVGMMASTFKSVRRRAFWLLAGLLVGFIRLLPDRLVVIIRSKSEIVRKMDYEHEDVLLIVDSEIEMGVRLHSCKKEPETVQWIETNFKENDVFFDVGANVGAYSLVASKFFNGNIKAYAFEPGFVTFGHLCRNILINRCQASITPLQIALSDKTNLDTFNYANLIPGGALHALGEPIDYKGDQFEPVLRQPVFCYRIDDLVQNFQIPVPNHIKLDVDGIEFNILKGADETLNNPSVKSIILELDDGDQQGITIADYLASKGFEFQSKHKYVYGGNSGPLSQVYNYIFRRIE